MTDPSYERALEEFFAAERLSRRCFFGRAGGAGLALSGLSAVLAACGGVEGSAEKQPEATPAAASHPKTAIGAWTFSNWPLYIDKKVLRSFDRKYGGDVRYVEDINDNFEFYGKVRQQLEQGKPIDRDIVVLTDYMAARWVRNRYAEAIDKKNVPNAANLVSNLKTINYDPKRTYTLPWQSGATGIGYNIKKTGRELKSVQDLFDPKFKGRVTFLAEPYDSADLVMIGDGIDASKANIDQIQAAIEKIGKANDSGQIRRFTGNDYIRDLTKGDSAMSFVWSGDAISLKAASEQLDLVLPSEGFMLFSDNMQIPVGAPHAFTAQKFMDFVYQPEIAAKIAAYVNYITPVKGAQEELRKIDPELAESPYIFPSDELLERSYIFRQLDAEEERELQDAFQSAIGA
jgi:spermidine/putrescine transport system substrate-binding protein